MFDKLQREDLINRITAVKAVFEDLPSLNLIYNNDFQTIITIALAIYDRNNLYYKNYLINFKNIFSWLSLYSSDISKPNNFKNWYGWSTVHSINSQAYNAPYKEISNGLYVFSWKDPKWLHFGILLGILPSCFSNDNYLKIYYGEHLEYKNLKEYEDHITSYYGTSKIK